MTHLRPTTIDRFIVNLSVQYSSRLFFNQLDTSIFSSAVVAIVIGNYTLHAKALSGMKP